MLHTAMSIHLHKSAAATASPAGWVSLDSPDGAHGVTIFVHDAESGRALIRALESAVAAEEARRAA